MAAHKHAEVIKAWADGAQIECRTNSGWRDVGGNPSWAEYNEYRVKQLDAKRVYPMTEMSIAEILTIWNSVSAFSSIGPALQALADQAIRRCCDSGQVVPRGEFDRALGDRKLRDMAVAKEVAKSLCWVFGSTIDERFNEEYLLPVIARVKS